MKTCILTVFWNKNSIIHHREFTLHSGIGPGFENHEQLECEDFRNSPRSQTYTFRVSVDSAKRLQGRVFKVGSRTIRGHTRARYSVNDDYTVSASHIRFLVSLIGSQQLECTVLTVTWVCFLGEKGCSTGCLVHLVHSVIL